MKLQRAPGAVKRFRKASWTFQRTYHTPLKDLDRFVQTIISSHGPIEKGIATISSIIFDPKALAGLLEDYNIKDTIKTDSSIEANGQAEVEILLKACLSDWVDFIFLPTPKRFVIYADHNEATTLFSPKKGYLSKISNNLDSMGFKRYENYERTL